MPREFRKRGRGGRRSKKNKNGEDETNANEVKIKQDQNKYLRDVMDIVLEDEGIQNQEPDGSSKELQASKFPELNPDLKAYWKEIDEKLQELERLGPKSGYKRPRKELSGEAEDDYDEDEDMDERQLILRAALNELAGHELSLATDSETSVILERIIYSMDDFAKLVLIDRFVENFSDLCTHRHASHVIQTLLALLTSTLHLESNDKLQEVIDQNKAEGGELPTISLLLAQISKDLMPHLSSLTQDPAGSHVLVVLLLLLFGKPIPEESYRSRKSVRWRSGKGRFTSVFKEGKNEAESHNEKKAYQVSEKVRKIADSLYRKIKKVLLDKNAIGARSAASNASAATFMKIIIELEFDHEEAERPGSLADNLLDGLMEDRESYNRSEFVESSLRDAAASHLLEEIISRLSAKAFSRFYATYLDRRIFQLCSHPVANFITAKSIMRLELNYFLPAFEECQKKMIDCIDNYRVGSIKSFVDRSIEFSQSVQQQVTQGVLKAFGIENAEDYGYIFPCLISLMRLEYFRKTTSYQLLSSGKDISHSELKLPESNIQGSLVLQSILLQDIPELSSKIVDGLMSLSLGCTIAISRDPIGSRTLDSLINSTTILPSSRRKLMLRLLGNYHILADDRIGSRIAESLWATADIYLKQKIASSLVNQQTFLNRSAFAHFFLKKLYLPLFERQINQWKLKMSELYPTKIIRKPKQYEVEMSKEQVTQACTLEEDVKTQASTNQSSDKPKDSKKNSKEHPKDKKKELAKKDKLQDSSAVDELFKPILKKVKTH
ncbi:armadillo-type protein [Phakopsora pachyrhizi]|uniref:Nucleolar protein 9 n=1 Tax=Phakopsora pachyrhizi TaxID=170000 RepID=A0AAV0AGN0_PHAPC|nr:armadillo-type protein [Phakopsora pachyrhizi]CAH7666660.1 armadillo-type protein [Phakopsora pachyrhizi]